MLIYDSHCHLSAIDSTSLSNTELTIIPSINFDEAQQLLLLRQKHNKYKIGLGIHPWSINDQYTIQDYIIQLRHLIYQVQPDFIGEIGLDYLKPHISLQRELFIQQIRLAIEFDLPIIIHCVKAYNDILCILKHEFRNSPQNKLRGIVHAFNANAIIAQQLIEYNFLLGIGGLVIKNTLIAKHVHHLVNNTRWQYVVFESDAPFMNSFNRAHSANCFLYAQIVAHKLNLNLIDLITSNNNNLRTLFNLNF